MNDAPTEHDEAADRRPFRSDLGYETRYAMEQLAAALTSFYRAWDAAAERERARRACAAVHREVEYQRWRAARAAAKETGDAR